MSIRSYFGFGASPSATAAEPMTKTRYATSSPTAASTDTRPERQIVPVDGRVPLTPEQDPYGEGSSEPVRRNFGRPGPWPDLPGGAA
ncbi:hypothetical protein P3T27_007533 [Kitasatospora sp. MAA19]|uniref:hypothetical protein n=1 Tax=unclassified Kitasatospora TaxID=2633591 RepID=UPI0024753F7A|nr:hypothetical protein [Kitasatospora sp. MAA19]MDH6710782.1 hypothetical protein [Kitasatospora sp. MAA19]